MISAIAIAEALGRPRPTDEQVAVIEAALAPALVVAGAGSGKTETMANRVLWLLANGHVKADQVLGLTFTRKAAGELAARIRTRIEQLAAAGLAPGYDPFAAPTISTYNAFANVIFRDNAILIGRESDGAVLGEASAWQLARSIVVRSGDERLAALGRSVDTVTRAVLSVSRAVSENIVAAGDVRAFAARFAALAELPNGGTGGYPDVDKWTTAVGSLDVLLDLAATFERAKADRGFVEYSDQVALALRIVRETPSVVTELRDRYPVVLLDEYQDTSVVQTWLLSELFGDHAVMAVGDPNQSIYGWRGASAANLDDFARQFGGTRGISEFNLATSWRNGHGILSVANALVEPLAPHAKVSVKRLEAAPTASDEPVEVAIAETLLDEAASTARWFKRHLDSHDGEKPSAAILFRTRKAQRVFVEALRAEGVPHHVLGVGGLLAEPEIADLVSALHVLHDPTAGSELVRLLAGSRWRIGVRDLRALRSLASWLHARDHAQQELDEAVREALRASVADGESGSIVDALDFITTAKPGHSQLDQFSDVGLERLRDAGRTFARLRQRAGLDVLDFVTIVEQELMLDIEVAANERRPLGTATMEALLDALQSYLAVDDSATLGGFLSWLREAEWRDNLAPRPEEPEPGTVQLLTIHGAKGLEWDLVAVPRMVVDELPSKPLDGTSAWLGFGQLPWPFRGDAAELPTLAWESVATRRELKDEVARFSASVADRFVLEERRLAYVAVTRARHSLLMSGSFWATQVKPRAVSPFLTELAERGIIGSLPGAPESDVNPLGSDPETVQWPLDPLGSRRPAVERAAELVRESLPGDAGPWQRDLDLLLAERAERASVIAAVDVPLRVPASKFKDYVTEPERVATSLRRPMPEKPYRATRLGTLFHAWVEQKYGVSGGTEELDAALTELDLDDPSSIEFPAAADAAALAALQATFERSPWASRAPVEVEREIHLILDGQIIVCKIDAVYADGDRFEVVDWKTGKAPSSAKDLEDKQLQLALYRLAYARWRGIDVRQIDAVFYYVADDAIIRPERIFDEDELIALWRSAIDG